MCVLMYLVFVTDESSAQHICVLNLIKNFVSCKWSKNCILYNNNHQRKIRGVFSGFLAFLFLQCTKVITRKHVKIRTRHPYQYIRQSKLFKRFASTNRSAVIYWSSVSNFHYIMYTIDLFFNFICIPSLKSQLLQRTRKIGGSLAITVHTNTTYKRYNFVVYFLLHISAIHTNHHQIVYRYRRKIAAEEGPQLHIHSDKIYDILFRKNNNIKKCKARKSIQFSTKFVRNLKCHK